MKVYEAVEAQKVHDIITGAKALFLTLPIGLLIANALMYGYVLMDSLDENRDYQRMLEGVHFEVEVGYTALWKLVVFGAMILVSVVLVLVLARCWMKQVKEMYKKLPIILISLLLTLTSFVVLGLLNLVYIQEFLFAWTTLFDVDFV